MNLSDSFFELLDSDKLKENIIAIFIYILLFISIVISGVLLHKLLIMIIWTSFLKKLDILLILGLLFFIKSLLPI